MISSQQLGERLADARKRAKLTQAQVAELVDLARTTLVAIEKGERRPSNVELVRLAGVTGTNVHELLREGFVRPRLSPRFRVDTARSDSASIVKAIDRLSALGAHYRELERIHQLQRLPAPLETLQTYRVEAGVPRNIDPRLEGEDAARAVRGILGLGDEPALEIDERFEIEAGLRIFYLDQLPATLSAFLIWSDDFGACVAINRCHPRQRQRWSLAHEVGHFLRDREAGDLLDEAESLQRPGELFPESFAREFLLPSTGVQKRFSERCRLGKFTPVDLYALARAFDVSFQAMALRLEELRLLPRGSYDRIEKSHLRVRDLAEHEGSVRQEPPRRVWPERFVALAVSAFEQALVSESEFAEILGTDIANARGVYQESRRIPVGEDKQLAADFFGADLRSA